MAFITVILGEFLVNSSTSMSYITKARVNVPVINTNSSRTSNNNNTIDVCSKHQHRAVNGHQGHRYRRYRWEHGVYDMMMPFSVAHPLPHLGVCVCAV